jgi:hypothetical protein
LTGAVNKIKILKADSILEKAPHYAAGPIKDTPLKAMQRSSSQPALKMKNMDKFTRTQLKKVNQCETIISQMERTLNKNRRPTAVTQYRNFELTSRDPGEL